MGVLVGLCWATPARADDVSSEFMLRFNELALRAEQALADQGADAAVAIYEQGLVDLDYGRVHLRLGELEIERGNRARAAGHFRACVRDERVDPMDRELICEAGFESITARLTITGLPKGARVVIVGPPSFVGPVRSGNRIPLGRVDLRVEAPERYPARAEIDVEGPTEWHAIVGEPIDASAAAANVEIPEDFIEQDPLITSDDEIDDESTQGAIRWPAYVAASTGLALVAGGVALGISNRGDLDDLRERQQIPGECGSRYCVDDLDQASSRARLADGMWISGVVVAASSVALWYLFDDVDGAGSDDE